MTDPIIKFQQKYVCIQTAVYWGSPQNDGFGGMTYADPVEIKVRWDEQTELITDDQGKEIVSKAQIILLQDVEVGGWLYLGNLTDLSSSQQDTPEDVSGAWRIKRLDKNPLFGKTSEFVRIAYV